jgi:hypothetical protein
MLINYYFYYLAINFNIHFHPLLRIPKKNVFITYISLNLQEIFHAQYVCMYMIYSYVRTKLRQFNNSYRH